MSGVRAGVQLPASRFRLRDPIENPLMRSCKLHLRRVCGVCADFDGELRQEGEGMCRRHAAPTGPRRDARDCPDFDRKTARP